MRRTTSRHPYAFVFGVLWLLPLAVAVGGYLLLPDDNWDMTCGSFGCGWPSNLAVPLMTFWIWLYFLLPVSLVALIVTAIRRADSSSGKADLRRRG